MPVTSGCRLAGYMESGDGANRVGGYVNQHPDVFRFWDTKLPLSSSGTQLGLSAANAVTAGQVMGIYR
jgi:hypothetical protein